MGWFKQRKIKKLVRTLQYGNDSSITYEAATTLDTLGWKYSSGLEAAFYLIAKRNWKELVQLGDPETVGPLIKALNDNDTQVNSSAQESLVELGCQIGKPAIIKIIEFLEFFCSPIRAADDNLGTISEMLRKAEGIKVKPAKKFNKGIIQVLSKIGEPVIEPLIQHSAARSRVLLAGANKVSSGAAKELRLLHVRQFINLHNSFWEEAAKCLKMLGSPAIDKLTKHIAGQDLATQLSSIFILNHMGYIQASTDYGIKTPLNEKNINNDFIEALIRIRKTGTS